MKVRRGDAQIEVKVPAQNGRKAYSYFRNANAVKKGAAGAGAALALGGLAAAAIALRKKPEESNALPAPVETPDPVIVPPSTASRVGEFAKKAAIGTGKTAATLAGSIAVNKAVSFAVKKVASKIAEKPEESSEARRARYAAEDLAAEEAYEQRKAAKDRERQAANILDRLPSPKPKVEVGGALVPVNKPEAATPPPLTRLPYQKPVDKGGALVLVKPLPPKASTKSSTVAPSESPKNTGNTIAKPQKTLLTKVSGSAGAALGRLVRKGKEGWERDRIAREKAARRTGRAARSVVNAYDNFARSFMQTFVDDNKTIDVQASEVKTTQRAMPKRTTRANKTMNRVWNKSSRRYESMNERIDSLVSSLLGV